ncbi:MAG: UDP-N-acetylmuramoyl-tripeptide--D-alanyl-D-alanine ligase [Bacteroidetes bacterium]|nr:UDP-N-acetylmuramoyl-tripeptide--D-alanyl-D-alanine ligase [Bacteroidota bacterium]
MNIADLYSIYKQYPSIQTDTRKLKQGDIFFALKGPNFNGNLFAQQALDAGAVYAVVDEKEYAVNESCILVDDVLDTLQQLAKYHRQQLNIPFIAITGSNGKTTTKELITAVLRKKYITYATEGNLNNHIGVPLTLLKIKYDAEMAVIEMGANHLKEIESYCKIALPTHAIITNCGKAHIEGFGGIEGVRKGKGELYDFIRENNGTIFRNVDLDYLVDMSKGIGKQITYGSNDAMYTGKPEMHEVFLSVALETPVETTIASQLVGDYNFPNVMVAIAVGLHFGVPEGDVQDAIKAYNPDNSRSQWMQKGSNKIILDAYNANPTSMRAAITNFANAKLDKKMLWIGAMKEMGTEEANEHHALVQLVEQYKWDNVILVGKEFAGIKHAYMHFETSADAAAYVKAHQPQAASILIKGSRGSKMEVLLDAIEG